MTVYTICDVTYREGRGERGGEGKGGDGREGKWTPPNFYLDRRLWGR